MRNNNHTHGNEPAAAVGKIVPSKVESFSIAQNKKPRVVAMANMRTGRIVRIGYKTANILSEKYPKEFEILKP